MDKLEKYMSVKEYADEMGIGTAAVHNRAKRGRLKLVNKNGRLLVNTRSYKPGVSGRPKKVEVKHDKRT